MTDIHGAIRTLSLELGPALWLLLLLTYLDRR